MRDDARYLWRRMRIFRYHTGLPTDLLPAVVAIGNFDGVHLGHKHVIETAREHARALGAPLAVLTFEPHPRSYFQSGAPPFRLTPFRSKAHQLEALGVDILFVLPFDAALAAVPAEQFASDILVKGLRVRHVVVGYNFAFGHGRKGDVAQLRSLAAQMGFGVTSVGPVDGADGVVYSSSAIRRSLQEGDVARAGALLGRPWEIEGLVQTGARLGRTLGFPTANLLLDDYVRPAYGVYAVRCGVEAPDGLSWHPGAANFGRRPTVDGTAERLEAHLFDFTGDLYGKHLRVAFVERLRAETKFDGLDALKAQIAKDCLAARRILGAMSNDGARG
jgi:riboflavin kinase/FMN adenylyltransferase